MPVIHILIADDDPEDHYFIKEALKKINFVATKVTSVHNGLQALDVLLGKGEYRYSKEPRPDLVIMDLNMPLVGGIQVLTELKNNPQNIGVPIFVLSSVVHETDRKKCRALGCVDLYEKATGVKEVQKQLEKMLNKIVII